MKLRICSEQMADKKWYSRATLFGDLTEKNTPTINTEISDKSFDTKKEADEYIKQKYINSGYYIEIV